MKLYICLFMSLLLFFNCASTTRVQFTNGEDDGNKIARVIIPPFLFVKSVNQKSPNSPMSLDNRRHAGYNKIFNLFPGKYVLEILFGNAKFTSNTPLPLTIEAKEKDVLFLCFDLDYNTKTWKPRLLIPTADQFDTEEVMGLFNIYLKNYSDREKCFGG